MSLNSRNNKFCCSRCGEGGDSIDLYAKVKMTTYDKAYKELLDKECFSMDRSHIEISSINLLASIERRNEVYRALLNMLKLEIQHSKYLENIGFLKSSIDEGLYRTIPKNNIRRRLIAYKLSKKYNLAGIPGLYQKADGRWTFSNYSGFFVPVFDENKNIQGLSIHLDKPYYETTDLWFSSNGKFDGTAAKSWIMKDNITEDSDTLIIVDNFLLGNLIKETTDLPIIAFQSISNSYKVLKEVENTKIENIIFVFKISDINKNIDYIIRRIMRDLLPIGYNIDIKYVRRYKDFLNIDFDQNYTLKKVV